MQSTSVKLWVKCSVWCMPGIKMSIF
jgi:hypothetical protein